MGIVDTLGRILYFPGWKKKKLGSHPKNIAVLRFDHIGDVINTTPFLKSLRDKFPDSVIDVYVSPWGEEALSNNPRINNVFVVKTTLYEKTGTSRPSWGSVFGVASLLKLKQYDLGISVRGDLREILMLKFGKARAIASYGITGGGFLLDISPEYKFGGHEIDINLSLASSLGCSNLLRDTEFFVSEELRKKTELLGLKLKKYGVLHTGSGAPVKRWHPYKYAKLISLLQKDGVQQIVLIGSADETDSVFKALASSENIIDLGGKTTLGELGAVVSEAAFFVGTDSGPAHIAAALKVPSVIIFSGANLPTRWAPQGSNITVIYRDTSCSPCCSFTCRVKGHPCMESITEKEVFGEIKKIIEEK